MEEQEFEMNAFDVDNIELIDSEEEFIELNEDHSEELENETPNEDPKDPEEVVGDIDQEKEDTESDDAEEDSSESSNLYSSFASVLNEQGVLPSLDLEKQKVSNIDDLTEAIKNEIDSQYKNYLIDKIGEEGYEALEKGISLQEYQTYINNTNNLESVTEAQLEEDIELAKKIIYQDYINQGIPEDRVARMIDRLVDIGEEAIIEDSIESLESLKKFEKIKLQKRQEEESLRRSQYQKQQEKIDNDVKNMIYKSSEIIKGMGKPTKTLRDKVYTNMTKIVSRSPEGILENGLMRHRRENPIDFDVKLYYIYELTKGFTDFSGIVSKSKSKAMNALERNLRQNKLDSSSSPSYMEDPNSYFGIGDELV